MFGVLLLFFCACAKNSVENKEVKSKVFEKKNKEYTNIDFVNRIMNTKEFNIFNYRNFYNGGGVAIGDINNDGLVDVYFSANMSTNKLYLNKGGFTFEDISKSAGIELKDKWSTGVIMVDINADGWKDIYVCNAGYKSGHDQKNVLFINQKDGTFKDEAAKYGLDENGYTTHAAFFDYDHDDDLDVYILNNSFIPVNTLNYNNKRELRADDWKVKDFLKGGGDKLLRNDGDKYVDVSEDAGIFGSLIGFGLGVTIGDVNNDNWPDIYISNDFFERDYLYINNRDGTFKEDLENRIDHISHSSMGADMADINNDGHLEIFVTDMLPSDDYRLKKTTTFDNINLRNLKVEKGFYNQFMHNTLQLNQGDGNFDEISFYSGVAASDWSWGALMFDADNDGFTDLYVCNGIYKDVTNQDFIDFFANDVIQKMVLTGNKKDVDSIISKMPSEPIPNHFFKNIDGLKFENKGDEFGFSHKSFSNGAAYGDLDNDGDPDLVVNNVNQEAFVYENLTNGSFIGLKISYLGKNIDGLGSTVSLFSNGKIYTHQIQSARGFQSSVDDRVFFGLDNIEKIDSIRIIWPNGMSQQLKDPDRNKIVEIKYDKQVVHPINNIQNKKNPVFINTDSPFADHMEDSHIDFYYERNIPMQISKEGPCHAIGDINGDSKDDIFIGGAAGQSPQLYLSTKNGFKKHQEKYFDRFKAFEDTASEFADIDGDNDLDLIVCSGGNNPTYVARAFMDRVYENRNGNFELKFNAFPPNRLNTAVIRPYDFDGDGDLDIFLGRRSVPGEYGLSPGSHLFANNGKGQFLDITQTVIPELSLAGMVTDAKWIDLFGDEKKELVIVGEWMSPRVLEYDGVKFNIVESELSSISGWWQSLNNADIDQDGDQDLILGNIGENFYLQPSEEKPLFLWINDFDNNGALDKIITKRINGKDIPVFVKRDIIDQIPELKKDNILHNEFAHKTIQDLFDKTQLNNSIVKKVNNFSSTIALNNGDRSFQLSPLSPQVQLSSVNDILIEDFNNDSYPDLVLGGNNEYLIPQFSMIDACKGKLLINNRDNSFDFINNPKSGLDFKGVVRELDIINIGGESFLLTLINNKQPQLYKINGYE